MKRILILILIMLFSAPITTWAIDGEKEYFEGLNYITGTRQPIDNEKAFQYFYQAAEQGYTPAFVALGDMAKNGEGMPFAPEAAIRCYEAVLLNPIAPDRSLTRRWDESFYQAAYGLGILYSTDNVGIMTDYPRAYVLLKVVERNPYVYKTEYDVNYGKYSGSVAVSDANQFLKDYSDLAKIAKSEIMAKMTEEQIMYGDILYLSYGKDRIAWLNEYIPYGLTEVPK